MEADNNNGLGVLLFPFTHIWETSASKQEKKLSWLTSTKKIKPLATIFSLSYAVNLASKKRYKD